MKFVVSSSALSARLQAAGRVIIPKNTLPILGSFLFDIKGTRLNITASDNETTITTWVELAESDADLRMAINAKTIQDAIKEIPEQPLDIYVNENTYEVTVEYQNGQYNFMGQSADEYPTPPENTGEQCTLTLPAQKLLSGLSRALFAAADDNIRPVMNGVFFDMHPAETSIVASDGHKLALTTATAATASADASFILPKKPAQLAKAALSRETDDARVHLYERGAVIETANYTMYCRLVEGHYPNYNGVIPRNNPNEATVNRSALLAALRRVLIFSNAASALIKLRIENGRLVVSSQDIDFSMSAEESLLCDYNGTPITIGFKGTFLVDLLGNLEGEEVVIRLADSTRAGVITPAVQPEGESVLMLLMPMMLAE